MPKPIANVITGSNDPTSQTGRHSMRSPLGIVTLFASILGLIGPGHTAQYETGHTAQYEKDTDRPGMDYNSVTLPRGSDELQCEVLCHSEDRCVAWTFVKAGIQAPNPRCWLKESIPVAKSDTCCFSGAVRRGIGPEHGVDRQGGDYTSFNLPGGHEFPDTCQSYCDADAFCVAWTYVKPGIQAPNPRCWLKSKLPPPQKNECCVSGVK